ncbi:hypothetical protein, partial [Cronobacter sakazakii]|uniref:hypothetical protein n=1 Tax=Cronobacter sakazakii TaxID=28141 RepID=UPI001F27A545
INDTSFPQALTLPLNLVVSLVNLLINKNILSRFLPAARSQRGSMLNESVQKVPFREIPLMRRG